MEGCMNNIDNLTNIWPEWKIIKCIGEGSFGNVYKAVRDEYVTPVYSAIKVITIPNKTSEILELKAEGLDEKALKEYYRQKVKNYISEIELMEVFKGTANVVNIEDYKVVEKNDAIGFDIYIRMELLTSFNDYLKKNILTQKEIIRLGVDICTALEMFEQKKIIHRDIKPENLFITDYGEFKVGDLGIARKLNPEVKVLSAKGTYAYMAPEVFWGKSYNIRADIYSLGIVLYRLCNKNRLPFSDTDSNVIDVDERKNISSRRLKGETLPKPIDADDNMAAAILHACEYNPDERFQTPTEFKNALIAIDNGENVIFDKRKFTRFNLQVIIGVIVFLLISILISILVWVKVEKNIFVSQNEKFTDSEENSPGDTEISEQDTTKPETTTEVEQVTTQVTTETETTTGVEQVTTELETTTEVEQVTTESETTTEFEPETEIETESETQTEQRVTEPAETSSPTEAQTEVTYEGYIVPEGCKYFAESKIYSEGMTVDVPLSQGHRLETKDYIYSYTSLLHDVGDEDRYCGWNVQVINSDQTEYEELQDSIAGEKLLMMDNTFFGCVNMKKSPDIPDSVKYMEGTFAGCGSLIEIPFIPEGVVTLKGTFEWCEKITKISNIPAGVKNMEGTFSCCLNLQYVPELPHSVTNMSGTFWGCEKLSKAPKIPNGVLNMKETFRNCDVLYEAPEIPDTVINMENTFMGCMSLKTAPVIPSSVNNMSGTFNRCSSLTGELVINANPIVYKDCFRGVDFSYQNLTLTGSSIMLEELRSTCKN